MGCGDEKWSKYLTQTFIAHCNAMICQQVTLSGDAEWPKVANAVIEAKPLSQKSICVSHVGVLTEVTCNAEHVSKSIGGKCKSDWIRVLHSADAKNITIVRI